MYPSKPVSTKRTRLAKALVVITWVSSLAGCLYIVNNIEKNPKPVIKHCQPFQMPLLKPIPGVPSIPDSILGNKDKTDTILVNKIDELREYARYVQSETQRAVDLQAKTCD